MISSAAQPSPPELSLPIAICPEAPVCRARFDLRQSQAACKTTATFQPNDLPFRMPENVVIYDTDLFYAIILKSVARAPTITVTSLFPKANDWPRNLCFPITKSSPRDVPNVEALSYTNISPKHRIMAVYAGTTLAEANSHAGSGKGYREISGRKHSANACRLQRHLGIFHEEVEMDDDKLAIEEATTRRAA